MHERYIKRMEALLQKKHPTPAEAAELKELLDEYNGGVKARFRPAENKAQFHPEGVKNAP